MVSTSLLVEHSKGFRLPESLHRKKTKFKRFANRVNTKNITGFDTLVMNCAFSNSSTRN